MSLVVTLDGIDVSDVAIRGSWERRLNRPSSATITIPMWEAIGAPGSRLKITLDGTIKFHGFVLNTETDTSEDGGSTIYNAQDPMELWQWRPVRADDGDFSKPSGDGGAGDLFDTYATGALIMQAVLKNTEGSSTAQGNQSLLPPTFAEGKTFLTFGTFETGGAPLYGAPADWPMSIAELFTLFASTGTVDLIIEPTDPGGGVMGTVTGWNGDYGTNRTSTVVFRYGQAWPDSQKNVRRMRWNSDMTQVCNKLWYYGGPRIGTSQDPAGDQHWCWNITGDDPAFNPAGSSQGAWGSGNNYALNDVVTSGGLSFIALQAHTSSSANQPLVGNAWPAFWAIWRVPPGGRNSPPASATNNQLGVRRILSQNSLGPSGTGYGVRMQVKIFDGLSGDCLGPAAFDPGRELYRSLWQMESWIRAVPRDLVHITPIAGYGIGTFDIGDLVTVEASADIRGGFSGAQRIYGYSVSWDENGPLELSELQTSSDAEGF